MSLGYADRLKQRRNLGGQLGAQEYQQSFEDIKTGVQSLAKWVADAKRVFVFTGAGISTACGIPDFRGPNGIWTLRKKKAPLPTDFTPFEYARPSFTHMAIAALVSCGKVPYVCSQNVDSLHLWSGVPRAKLAELHGNCFAERCTECRTEYARDFQMETVDFKPTGRRCARPGCGGALVDNILDWDTPLPQDELDEAVQQAEEADVALVLGTSLQIQPANEIPVLTRDEGGKMVIVNLQKTPKDRKAHLLIRARCDIVMALLCQELGVQVPPFVRTETLVVEHTCSSGTSSSAADGGSGSGSVACAEEAAAGPGRLLTVTVRSRHGHDCPLPMVESVNISVCAADDDVDDGRATTAVAHEGAGSGTGDVDTGRADGSASGSGSGATWAASSGLLSGSRCCYSHSFRGVPSCARRLRCTLAVRLVKWADEDKRDVVLQHSIDLSEAATAAAAATATGTTLVPSGDGGGGDMGRNDDIARVVDTGAAASTSGSRHVHTFVSQESYYEPESVITAFLANPPPVVLPDPPRKRQKTQPAAPVAPARVSLRQTRNSRKAQYTERVSESSPSAGSDDDNGEDDGN